jgi:hypothetical protein
MKTKTISLPANTYISNIEPFKSNGIPTNSIIHKEITGCGITTFEIRFAKHNSIIVLPNVPVIEGKVAEHNADYPEFKILGVYKGIDVHDIKAYLLTDIKYKKILTTPEGFSKIIKAFEGNQEIMQNDYFLLYDECERIVTDISYRGAIAAPFDIFFKFKDKALVSATTLPFSDVRFKEFERYQIEPDFDYSKDLTLISTNNVVSSLKKHLDELDSEHVCIFLNSTNGIHAVTKTLDIKSASKAFCSQESVVKLMEKKYSNASSRFQANDMAKHNFFTSRYYSAFDIKLDYQPDVIIITDILFAPHSIIDPNTEAIQIAGRFRNGINSLTHITNYNPTMEVRTQHEALTYLEGCLDTYEVVVKLFNQIETKGGKETLNFFINNSPIASFFNDGKRNPFMIDNSLNEERVKGYFLNSDALNVAYEAVSKHFNLTHLQETYPIADIDIYNLKQIDNKVDRYRLVAQLLSRWTAKQGHFLLMFGESIEQKAILTRKYPLLAEAVTLISLDELEATGYVTENIRRSINETKARKEIMRLAPHVQTEFTEHTTVSESDIINRLGKVFLNQQTNTRLYAIRILDYFNGRRGTSNGKNVYNLTSKKQLPPIHEID